MRYWGIDWGKEVLAMAAYDERGSVVDEAILKGWGFGDVLARVSAGEAVCLEWTGGRVRDLADSLEGAGVRVFLYEGDLKADRKHLGFGRKSDLADACTLGYVLWASLTRVVPIREGAVRAYAVYKEVYALRRLARAYVCAQRLRMTTLQSAHARGLAVPAYTEELLRRQEREAWERFLAAAQAHKDVVRVMAGIRKVFPLAKRAGWQLAVYLSPIERFGSRAALLRYLDLLPASSESGGKPLARRTYRQGCREARRLLYQLCFGSSRLRGLYRSYRNRFAHGQAMIRVMHWAARQIWKGVHGDEVDISSVLGKRRTRRDDLQDRAVALAAQGLSNRQISRALGLGSSTLWRWLGQYPDFQERFWRARLGGDGYGNDSSVSARWEDDRDD